MELVTIAVVAMGAMGSAVGARLATRGARVLTSLDGRSEATQARTAAVGLESASDTAIAGSDMILSVVPPDQSVALAERFAAAIKQEGTSPLYVDCNAINPATARRVGDTLAGCGAFYVDGSIIGMPPKADGAGPTFYLSGDAAATAGTILETHGLVAKTLPGGIGAASALKMSYAGITKGMTALGAAMILAARREGAGEALAAELAASQPELLTRLGRTIPDMLPKAYRWVPEMEEIAGFIGDATPGAAIYTAIAGLYQAIADDRDGQAALARELTAFFD